MDSQTFLDNFEIIAEAPGGIDRLRELILDLATRGQLADQVETESAIDLPATSGPYPLPASWIWVKLPDVTQDLGQKSPTNDFHYIDVGSIDSRVGRISDSVSIISADAAPSRARKKVAMGTVIYSTIRPYLRNIAIVDRNFDPEPIASTAFAVLHPGPHIDEKYLFICVRSPFFTRFVESKQKGVAYPAINASDLRMAPIPLPPLAEQQRIASTVQELLKLCDELEAAKEERDSLRTAARKSALEAISTANTSDELLQSWKRISSNWISFCHSLQSIEDLRELILDLAVRGDLVQDQQRSSSFEIRWTAEQLKLDSDRIWRLDTMHEHPRPGWSRIPLARAGKWGSGGTPTASRQEFYNGGSIPWAVIGDLNNEILTDTATKITDKALEASSAILIPKGAVLIAMYGASIGKTATTGIECATNQAIAHCVVDSSIITTDYLFLVARSLKRHLVRVGKGAAQPNISQTILRHLLIDIPPLAEQNEIVSSVGKLIEICDALSAALDQCIATSETLASRISRVKTN